MDDVNAEFPQADVALVIGANGVTNPIAGRPGKAIFSMPNVEVDKAN
ncbi:MULTISPECIES: NAD(P)(+) transhydrogenase (Re/Si-specific) subunit beta [unclassified Streptomyces]|nr:NAD(P)(+) transhydrogenase (Re/Si-specific) subunit beta [Streptomyces sp. NBC_00589]WTI41943.1 NAD(P)(+) transhydrogenase (Re/Si-specific) subunit beta [Streptomyces sp. NBC_00775]WUB24374.1 NAD(P)(+) transhydrogenase (Re/Si-specific) subunit beta [Streptomyces sp. NBC_00589]